MVRVACVDGEVGGFFFRLRVVTILTGRFYRGL